MLAPAALPPLPGSLPPKPPAAELEAEPADDDEVGATADDVWLSARLKCSSTTAAASPE